jgi:predicted transcriptional regulator
MDLQEVPMATSQKRSKQIKLTITPEIHTRLVALGEKLGQAPATLASLAISQYVTQQEAALGAADRTVDAMAKNLTPQMEDLLRQIAAEVTKP